VACGEISLIFLIISSVQKLQKDFQSGENRSFYWQ